MVWPLLIGSAVWLLEIFEVNRNISNNNKKSLLKALGFILALPKLGGTPPPYEIWAPEEHFTLEWVMMVQMSITMVVQRKSNES